MGVQCSEYDYTTFLEFRKGVWGKLCGWNQVFSNKTEPWTIHRSVSLHLDQLYRLPRFLRVCHRVGGSLGTAVPDNQYSVRHIHHFLVSLERSGFSVSGIRGAQDQLGQSVCIRILLRETVYPVSAAADDHVHILRHIGRQVKRPDAS